MCFFSLVWLLAWLQGKWDRNVSARKGELEVSRFLKSSLQTWRFFKKKKKRNKDYKEGSKLNEKGIVRSQKFEAEAERSFFFSS